MVFFRSNNERKYHKQNLRKLEEGSGKGKMEEFWIGMTGVYAIARSQRYDLRIELTDSSGVMKSVTYHGVTVRRLQITCQMSFAV